MGSDCGAWRCCVLWSLAAGGRGTWNDSTHSALWHSGWDLLRSSSWCRLDPLQTEVLQTEVLQSNGTWLRGEFLYFTHALTCTFSHMETQTHTHIHTEAQTCSHMHTHWQSLTHTHNHVTALLFPSTEGQRSLLSPYNWLLIERGWLKHTNVDQVFKWDSWIFRLIIEKILRRTNLKYFLGGTQCVCVLYLCECSCVVYCDLQSTEM